MLKGCISCADIVRLSTYQTLFAVVEMGQGKINFFRTVSLSARTIVQIA
jgi:hypothetical protein